MAPLSRDELLALDDRPVEVFHVPEWGRSVYLRAPALPAVLAIANSKDKRGPIEQARDLLAIGLGGADGNPFLSEADAAALLARISIPAANRIATRLAVLCGLQGEAGEKK
jgi:hypothetical protein